jgi:hypothetical protein
VSKWDARRVYFKRLLQRSTGYAGIWDKWEKYGKNLLYYGKEFFWKRYALQANFKDKRPAPFTDNSIYHKTNPFWGDKWGRIFFCR